MNKEHQNIEWKESWHEKYYKWICGFANAYGGELLIGVDDDGVVKGIDNANKLLVEVPNQTKNVLGILVDVSLIVDNKLEYLKIKVEPFPNPVSLRGKYYYRTGSTLQELQGDALTNFLLQKQGKRWDGAPYPNISVSELDNEPFEIFKKGAIKSKRLSNDDIEGDNDNLIDSLNLREGGLLKRAAILLFHPNPQKYFTGSSIKMGFFESDDDLKYQDEINGSLLVQVEKVIDLITTKYLKAEIVYEGASRVEKFPFPESAIREALLNAIAHKDYSSGIPIQISVYTDSIIFYNTGSLPDNWTVENLSTKHPSKPFNPDIANTLFRAGYIESWGRGTIKILNECINYKIPPPIYKISASDFEVKIYRYTQESLERVGLKPELRTIVLYVQENGNITNKDVQRICDVSKRTASRYLSDLENTYLDKSGTTGAGTNYIFKGAIIGP